MTKNRLFRVAHEAWMHAGQYAFNHRRRRKSQMKRVWVSRISAAAKNNGTSYSELMKNLKAFGSSINTKMLSEVAFKTPEVFSSIVKQVGGK